MSARFKLDDFRTLNHALPSLTGGLVAKGYSYAPGDGSRHYVGASQSWNGRDGGGWYACAYYAGQIMAYAQETGEALPTDVVDVIKRVRTEVPATRRDRAAGWEALGRADVLARIDENHTVKVTNAYGVRFTLVYRAASRFSYPAGGPVVEVYDTRFDFTRHGQFVTRIGTDLDDLARLARHGWLMDGGIPEWSLTPENVSELLDLVKRNTK